MPHPVKRAQLFQEPQKATLRALNADNIDDLESGGLDLRLQLLSSMEMPSGETRITGWCPMREQFDPLGRIWLRPLLRLIAPNAT